MAGFLKGWFPSISVNTARNEYEKMFSLYTESYRRCYDQGVCRSGSEIIGFKTAWDFQKALSVHQQGVGTRGSSELGKEVVRRRSSTPPQLHCS